MAVLGIKGPGNGLPNIHFFKTTSWSPSTTTTAYVYVIGGGGSGGAVANNATGCALGGGAGGCAVSLLTLSSSVTYTATIGAGGGVAGASSSTTTANGSSGVNSMFAGSDISTMTGTGGSGGVADTSSGASGASGGTPTGGNIANYVGGSGYGNVHSATKGATGGGAVGLWMNGRAPDTNEQGTSQKLTRGGDLGGFSRGGANSKNTNPDFVAGNPIPVAMEPFAGMMSAYYTQQWADYDDANNYSLGFTQINTGMQSMFDDATIPFKDGTSEGTEPNASPFCGGGGVAYNLASISAGRGCLGGGGGGAYTTSTSSPNAQSGMGGQGCILIFPVSI
jgi:hypothetical protein